MFYICTIVMPFTVLQCVNKDIIYICQKIACCINLQLPILFFVKSNNSDIHHRKTYMHINFQQNRVISLLSN